MSELFLTINGRNYTVACEDGQEEHLGRLAEYVKMRVEELADSVGQIGDARLILMVALLISDELSDAYAEMASLREGGVEGEGGADSKGGDTGDKTDGAISIKDDAMAKGLEDLAARIDAIAQRLEDA
jgi:cell division protein ZapA